MGKSGEPIEVLVAYPMSWETRPVVEVERDVALLRTMNDRIQVTIAEYVEPGSLRIMRGQPPYDEARRQAPPVSPQQAEALAKAEIMLTLDIPFDTDRLAPRLKWVQAVGAGVGQLQSGGLDKIGAVLTTSAGVASAPIAEFVLARILAEWKLFPALDRLQRVQDWTPTYGRNLAGSTIGIVGFGAIGAAIAVRAKALGMRVLANRRTTGTSHPSVDRFFTVAELPALLGESDAVVLCAPETSETRRMFDRAAFAAMKHGAYFCNVARGSLVDEPAMIAALTSGQLSAASIDVATTEPLPPGHPLWSAPNLAISPHSAASVEKYFQNVWQLFRENMQRYLAGEELANRISSSLTG
ncbi:MAG: putative oxidoreductase [Rhodospirillales bacterium]|nr:putative oxidoreductase [Rhodospirillales bacterium]